MCFLGRRDRYEKTTLYWAETCVKGSNKLLVGMVEKVGGKNTSYDILQVNMHEKHVLIIDEKIGRALTLTTT